MKIFELGKKTMFAAIVGFLVGAIVLAIPLAVLEVNRKCDIISKEAQNYNIVFTNATVPLNMASMDIWTSSDTTYFWYSRRDSFQDKARLADKVKLVGNAGTKNMTGIPTDEIKTMAKKVAKLYKANKNNTFKLYINDYAIKVPMMVFYGNKIPESQFQVIICEDGMHNGWNNMLTPSGDKTEQVIIDEFNENVTKLATWIENSKNGNQKWDRQSPLAYWPETLAYMTYDNVEYWHQGRFGAGIPAGVRTETVEKLNQKVVRLWANSTQLANGDRGLSNELIEKGGKNAVDSYKRTMFGNKLENLFKVQEGGKKPLIVTGTSYTGERLGFEGGDNGQFETVFNKVKQVYGDDYFFIYKGHPAWPTHEGWDGGVNWKSTVGVTKTDFDRRVQYLNNSFDYQIDAQIPADMIMLFYADEYTLNFGGYDSSLFAAANGSNHNVLFFITGNEKNLPSAGTIYNAGGFNRIIDSIEYKPGFITPNTIGTFTGWEIVG